MRFFLALCNSLVIAFCFINIAFVKNRFSRNYYILFHFTHKNVRKTADTGPPIEHPSICFIKREFTEEIHSFVSFTNNFLKIDSFTECFHWLINIDFVQNVLDCFFNRYACKKWLFIIRNVLVVFSINCFF